MYLIFNKFDDKYLLEENISGIPSNGVLVFLPKLMITLR